MADIHEELKTILEKVQNARRVQRHLEQLNIRLQKAYDELDQLEQVLEKEFKDVEQLDKLSVKGLFHKILGSKEQQIEKERQEYLQASLKFNEHKKSVELLEYERSLLENKITNLKSLEETLEKLIAEREKLLIQEDPDKGPQILDVIMEIDETTESMKQLSGIFELGKEALFNLDKMVQHLEQAKNWGRWDMMGRGPGMSYIKHSSIDKARDISLRAKHILMRYEDELKSVFKHTNFSFNIHIDTFSRFTDIFFDNLISDWIIQQKIQKALSDVVSVRRQVGEINTYLQKEINKLKNKILRLEEKRRQFIIS
jgi:hypothetical protein